MKCTDHRTPLDTRMLKVANDLMDWVKAYLMAENPDVKRPYMNTQVVCPFVEASINSNYLYMDFHPDITGNERVIEGIMLDYLSEFTRLDPFDPRSKHKKALLVVFPDLQREKENNNHTLDIVHERVKSQFVLEGMMVGQFHKDCKEAGIHNPLWLPSRSPHPLIAIRNMARHDIIFLADAKHPDWFEKYNARFGDTFRDPERLDGEGKALYSYYRRAKDTYLR